MDDRFHLLISLWWAAMLVAIVIAVFVITAHVRLWNWRRKCRRRFEEKWVGRKW